MMYLKVSGLLVAMIGWVPAQAAWDFRGEPNNWAQTRMTQVSSVEWVTTQNFAQNQNEFKVARDDGWSVSFPEKNYTVEPNNRYRIQFFEDSSNILTTAVTVSLWNFRGSSNTWGETPMEDLGNGLHQTCQKFAHGDEAGPARFKIARDGWNLSYPEHDVVVAADSLQRIVFNEFDKSVTVTEVTNCTDTADDLRIIGQKRRLTLKNTAFTITADMLNVAGASEFEIIVSNGENYRVEGETIIPDPDFIGELEVPLAIASLENSSPEFVFQLSVVELSNEKNLLINKASLLNRSVADLSLVRFFDHLAQASGEQGLTGVQLFRQFWDIQNRPGDISVGPNCGDETMTDGITAALNGFPIPCDRRAGTIVKTTDNSKIVEEMQRYSTVAAVNRFDLHAEDFSDCGEQRMVFSREIIFARLIPENRLIAEARIPNPTPGDAAGCLPLINFWLNFSTVTDDDNASQALEQAYYNGIENFPAFFSIKNFGKDAGQLRTNQFLTVQWMLREFELDHSCSGQNCTLRAVPVTAKETPFGLLFNGNETTLNTEFTDRALAFQENFMETFTSLTNNNLEKLSIKTDDIFNNGRSFSSGNQLKIDEAAFNKHFNNGKDSSFFSRFNGALEGSLDALGNPLTAEQVLNRATALTCAGCHVPRAFGLTRENAIGAMRLPSGDIIDSWPSTSRFTHVGSTEANNEFDLSDALKSVFLPVRATILQEYLTDLSK